MRGSIDTRPSHCYYYGVHTADETFDLNELSDLAAVTVRTIRHYIQQGLLPPPGSRGPGTRYQRGHLDRLNLIKRLQKRHLPLADIRKQLQELDDQAVREVLRAPEEPQKSSALSYVRDVLAGSHGTVAFVRATMAPAGEHTLLREPAPPAAVRLPMRHVGERSQWERIRLASDVELHVRRPLSRELNKRVDRLVELARTLFDEDSP